ncbi:hypothetical protein LTR86_007870 [Recurvomyces mirabilis]|nr:hypothetical protein LTR86_007870 [Recurvomyces mirabilis]
MRNGEQRRMIVGFTQVVAVMAIAGFTINYLQQKHSNEAADAGNKAALFNNQMTWVSLCYAGDIDNRTQQWCNENEYKVSLSHAFMTDWLNWRYYVPSGWCAWSTFEQADGHTCTGLLLLLAIYVLPKALGRFPITEKLISMWRTHPGFSAYLLAATYAAACLMAKALNVVYFPLIAYLVQALVLHGMTISRRWKSREALTLEQDEQCDETIGSRLPRTSEPSLHHLESDETVDPYKQLSKNHGDKCSGGELRSHRLAASIGTQVALHQATSKRTKLSQSHKPRIANELNGSICWRFVHATFMGMLVGLCTVWDVDDMSRSKGHAALIRPTIGVTFFAYLCCLVFTVGRQVGVYGTE